MCAAARSGPPPRQLIHGLLAGPAFLSGFEWHDEIDSTNRRVAELAAEDHPEGYAVAADVQIAGRGRQGRTWTAPAGTSLLVSFLLRPGLPTPAVALLPLLAGVVLAEVVERHVPGVPVALKWPNDLLVGGAKAAGILVEQHGDAAIVGMGLNVDWRGVDRPGELAVATSLADALAGGAPTPQEPGAPPAGAEPEAPAGVVSDAPPAGAEPEAPAGAEPEAPAGVDSDAPPTGAPTPIDRWRIFAGLVGVLGNRYADWRANPDGVLPEYRARCATLGQRVRLERPDGPLEGLAEAIADSGALVVRADTGAQVEVAAGDVTHLRPGR